MKSNELQTAESDALADAINAERTAQNAYAKVFFVIDKSHSDTVALLRLLHTDSTRILEDTLKETGAALPDYLESEGPFSRDPRNTVFEIEYPLIHDYFVSAEKALEAKWERLVEAFPALEEAYETRKRSLADLLAALEESPIAKHEFAGEDHHEQPLAQCG